MKTKIFALWCSLRSTGLALVLTMLLGSGASAQNYQNRLVNPGFEDGFNTGWSNWMPDYNFVETDPANVHSGTQSISLKPGTWTGSGFGQPITSGFNAGENFTLSAYGKVVGTTTGHISIQFVDADGNKTNIHSADFANTGSFEKQSLAVVIPDGTASIIPNVWYDNNDGSVLYVDDFMFTLNAPNLVANPGFEDGLTSWSNWSDNSFWAKDTTANFSSGAKSMRLLSPPSGGAGFGQDIPISNFAVGDVLTATCHARWDDGLFPGDIWGGCTFGIQVVYGDVKKNYEVLISCVAGDSLYSVSTPPLEPGFTKIWVDAYRWLSIPGKTVYYDDYTLTKSAAAIADKTGTGFHYSPSYITVTGGGAMPDTTNGVVLSCDGTGATDVTACMQAALDDAASQGKALLIPYTAEFYKISDKLDVKCSVIGIGGMPTIKQTNDLAPNFRLMDNMTGWIYNLHLTGTYDGTPKPLVQYEFGHNVTLRGVNGVTISNNLMETPQGDNIGNDGGAQSPVRNVLITNNTFVDPWRCNISIDAIVDRMAVMNNKLYWYSQYVDPIDIEPYQDATSVTNVEVSYNDIQSPKPVLTDETHFYEAILQVTAWWDPTPGGNIISHHNWGDWGAPFTKVTGYQGGPSTWTNILSLNNVEGTVIPGTDLEAPSIASNLSAMEVTKTSFILSWEASTDNVGVIGYLVYQDGVLVGITDTPSYTLSGLICGKAYSIKVKAYDADGNTSVANPGYNVATLDCAGGTNLLVNPGFEQPLSIGWIADWGGNALDSTTVRSGKYSLNVGPGDGGRAQEYTAFIAGGTYILSAYGIITGIGGHEKQDCYIGAEFKDADGARLGVETAPITDTVNWQKTSVTFTVPENTAKINIYVYFEARGITTNNVLTDDWSLIAVTPVTGVSVDPATVSLPVGIVKQVKAVLAPIDATNQKVTWSSSDETIATVDSTGMIQAIKTGDATITASSEDGGLAGTSAITVTAPTANLLKNPGIEQALSVGWTQDWGNNNVIATTPHSGAKCLAIGPADGGRAQKFVGFVPGSTYTLSAYGLLTGTGFSGQRTYIGAIIKNAAGTWLSNPRVFITDSIEWQQYSLTFTLPLETTAVEIFVYLEAGAITTTSTLTDDWALISGWEPLKFSGVGLNKAEKGNLKLYPNPLTGQSLNIAGAKGAESMSIYDMSGRLVYTQKLLNADVQQVKLSESLSKGSYIVKVTGKTGINSQLLLVK